MTDLPPDGATSTRRHGGGVRVVLRGLVPPSVRRVLHRSRDWLETAQHRFIERRHGIDIRGNLYLEDVGVETEDRVFYDAIGWLPLRRALRSLRPGPGDVFADVGSGKGGALVIAGRFPFARVLGIEFVEQLSLVARANIDRARPHLRVADIQVLTIDAVDWEVPDDLSILFMYCPFTGEVFEAVMARVFASFDRRPRPLHLVYAFPSEHNMLLASGRVEVVDVGPAQWPAPPWWPWSGWVMPIYRVIPRDERPRPAKAHGWPLRRAALRRWRVPSDQPFGFLRPGRGITYENE